MFGFGGQGDKLYAEFQAKLLSEGRPPEYDPAEEHMRNVLAMLGVWSAVSVLVAAPALWFFSDLVAAIVVGVTTTLAVNALVVIRRRNQPAAGPLETS